MGLAVELFLLSIAASFIQRVTGFGFGILIMTALPFLLPSYGEATTLSGLLAMTTSLIVSIRMRKYLVIRDLIPILVTFIIVSTVSIFCLKRMDSVTLRRILGITLILLSFFFIFFSGRIHLKPNMKTQVGAGALSGLMGGFFGMQGPPAVLYFVTVTDDKKVYMALVQTYFFIGNLMMLMVRAYNGFLTKTVGIDYLYGLGGVLIGMTIGTWVFSKIPGKTFRYIVYGYIGISGIVISLTV